MEKSILAGRERVKPLRGDPPRDLPGLVELYGRSGAFNGGRLYQACRICERMVQSNATVALTIAGALTPAGLGGLLARAVEAGLVDFIISTGANLYHDIHFGLGLPVHQGDFRVDDMVLLAQKVVRVYDVFIDFDTLEQTDEFVRRALKGLAGDGHYSSADIHYALGEAVANEGSYPEVSLLATCYKYDIPIYTPSFGDSSIGINVAQLRLTGSGILVDPNRDVLETASLVYCSEKNGVVELGGGAPKNFYLQTEPVLDQFLGMRRKGHDYIVQITSDAPYWGGLSGATPSEAASWGKVDPEALEVNSAVVYCDLTVAAPIVFSYLLAKDLARQSRRLYKHRDGYRETLEADYAKRVRNIR